MAVPWRDACLQFRSRRTPIYRRPGIWIGHLLGHYDSSRTKKKRMCLGLAVYPTWRTGSLVEKLIGTLSVRACPGLLSGKSTVRYVAIVGLFQTDCTPLENKNEYRTLRKKTTTTPR